MTLKQLVDFLTVIPAETFNLPYGKLAENELADLTLINLELEEKVDKESFHSKSKNTPFDGWNVTGIPVLTIVNGEIVYEASN